MESIKFFFIGLYLAKLNDAIYEGHTFVCFMMLFGDNNNALKRAIADHKRHFATRSK